MRWSREVDAKTNVEQWTLVGASTSVRWIVYAVRATSTRVNPSGELWRAMRGADVLRLHQRVRSWRSRHAAMGAVEELARLEARG